MDDGTDDGATDSIPPRALQLRSLVTAEGSVELSLAEVDVPEPRADQVLVRVEAAPVNPSDLGLLLAGADPAAVSAGGTPDRPVATAPLTAGGLRAATARVGASLPAGNEGAGTVVAAGSDPAAQALLGRVVAVAGGAMYAQFRALRAADCLVLPEGTPAADGAASYVNPMTVLGMIDTMRDEGHTALVHTAAASNLGQMLMRVCRQDGVGLVNVVRSAEQVRLLRDAGAEHVVDSTAESFAADLAAAVAATGATLAFDAVGGGPLVDRILTAMEAAASAGAAFSRYGSAVHKQVYVYGGLDRGPTTLSRGYGTAWGVGGWLVTPFLEQAGPERVATLRRRVADGLTTTFASPFSESVTLAGALDPAAIAVYGRPTTGGKFLVTPHG